jgi:hypothetical protein
MQISLFMLETQNYRLVIKTSGIELAKESGLFQLCKAGMRETDHSE